MGQTRGKHCLISNLKKKFQNNGYDIQPIQIINFNGCVFYKDTVYNLGVWYLSADDLWYLSADSE